MRDMLSPVIRLEPLTKEEMFVLTEKLTAIHSVLFGYEPKMTENDLFAFIKSEYSRIGADVHITPREVIRDFIELLDIMYQNPQLSAEEILGSDAFVFSKGDAPGGDESEGYEEFEI